MAAATWPHWELQLLHAASLPRTDGNRNWLRLWQLYEQTTCDRNPLNTYWQEPGSHPCKRLSNGKEARAYASRETATDAFSLQLNLTDYPQLRAGFLLGDPFKSKEQDAILVELQKWGALRWRAQVASLDAIDLGGTTPGPVNAQSADVAGAWTRLNRVLSVEGRATIVALQKATAALRRIERKLQRV